MVVKAQGCVTKRAHGFGHLVLLVGELDEFHGIVDKLGVFFEGFELVHKGNTLVAKNGKYCRRVFIPCAAKRGCKVFNLAFKRTEALFSAVDIFKFIDGVNLVFEYRFKIIALDILVVVGLF